MRVVLIGAGGLATNLGQALHEAGHELMAVYSRTMQSARLLADKLGCKATNDLGTLPLEADVFIVSVKDAVLDTVISQLAKGREGQLMVHTAGSMPMALFEGKTRHYGVLYPMQSFSKERQVDFNDVSIFLETSDEQSLATLKVLANSISPKVYELSSEERKYLHLSAVFACNFVNHCYALSAEILERLGLPFSVMLPLTDETARKVHQLQPKDAQTGPAVRYDQNVISMQNQLLADQPEMQQIYELMTKSIHQKAIER